MEDRSIFKNGLVPSEQHFLSELNGATVYHLEFTIADDLYHVTGTEKVYYTNTEDVTLDRVEFRLFPNILGGEMKISNLTVDDQSITPDYGLERQPANRPLIAPARSRQKYHHPNGVCSYRTANG